MNNYQRNGQRDGFRGGNQTSAQQNKSRISEGFNPKWITEGVDEDCMKLCEELAQDMVDKGVSSSFLRNVFGELRRIEAGGFEKHRSDFVLLRPKLAYSCGRAVKRNAKWKDVLEDFQNLYKKSAECVKHADGFRNLVSIMEAIVAFHKAKGGEDK